MSIIHLPPTGDLLNSYANARLSWATALGELIDNAFDAGAATFSAEFTKDVLLLRDDGHGCADPTNMIRLGSHAKHASTKLGRYGIGGKDAALWIGGLDSTIGIRTEHAGVLRSFSVNWREFGAKGWEVEAPTEEPGTGGEYRTEIRISPVKKPPHGEGWRELLVTLGYLYSAALKRGRQIKFKRAVKGAEWEPLVRWELPKFDGAPIDTRIEVKGRGARVFCGVVLAGELNPRAGFTYSHEWRVIEQATANGCGDRSAARVCGFVDLDASWPLTKNKDGVSRDTEALYEAVEAAARPILERAHAVGTELRSRQFDSIASDLLNEVLTQRAKAKRSKGTTTGTKQPTGAGGAHTRAGTEQQGQRFRSHQTGRFLLDFKSFGHPDDIGEFKAPSQVFLNLDNHMVAECRRRNETNAIVIMALALVCAEHCGSEKPLLKALPSPSGISASELSKMIGALLQSPISVDGKAALKVVS